MSLKRVFPQSLIVANLVIVKRVLSSLLLILLLLCGLTDRAEAAVTPLQKTASGSLGENPNNRAYFDPLLVLELQRDRELWAYDLGLGVDVGPNLYAYVRQNPWTHFDPLGLYIPENDEEASAVRDGLEDDLAKYDTLKRDHTNLKKVERFSPNARSSIPVIEEQLEQTAQDVARQTNELEIYLDFKEGGISEEDFRGMRRMEQLHGEGQYIEPGIVDVGLGVIEVATYVGLRGRGRAVLNKYSAPKSLTKGDLTDYLSNTKGKTHAEISQDMQRLGLKVKGQSPDGRFTEFVDKAGNVRAKLHPPDKVTKHPHLHIYDKKGNALDAGLNRVSPKSPDAHIETGG